MTTPSEIIPAQPAGALNVHGMDDETKARVAFLARYHGRTLENCEMDLDQYRDWLRDDVRIHNMLAAEPFILELYLRHLIDRGLATATVCRRFGTVRGFYKRAHQHGLINRDPTADVELPKIKHDQQYRTWFESVDMAIILRKVVDPLDRVVLQMMFDLSLRVGELCALDVESIAATPTGPRLRFIGKGNEAADMAIPPTSMAAITAYLDGRTTGPLILNKWGNRTTRYCVQRIIDRVAKKAEIPYHVGTHGLRRTSCRFGIQMGETVADAAGRLRHKDTKTTLTCYAIDTGLADINRARVSALMANLAR